MEKKRLAELCRKGEKADALFNEGRTRDALKAYADIAKDLEKNRDLDSYIAARLALGTLRCHIKLGDFKNAYAVWNANIEENVYGIGIYALESAQTSIHDMLAYDMICAFLHSLSDSNKEEVASAVNQYLSRVCEQAEEDGDRSTMKLALSNWKQHLREVYGGSIPLKFAKPLIQFEKSLGEPVVPQAIDFPKPDAWEKPQTFREMSHVMDMKSHSHAPGAFTKTKKKSAS